ncbi:hypothetical protein HPB51_004851 [Rhipicephalus microplus]|uniref:Uncharacterized protein n=1 Tax=Rhipicephalus microplus TaxID=6941 RepID=A0A9J6ERU1_RHIMP|nr:hypothetical protein HPB51_004851 [Rhipicephalus microplus]
MKTSAAQTTLHVLDTLSLVLAALRKDDGSVRVATSAGKEFQLVIDRAKGRFSSVQVANLVNVYELRYGRQWCAFGGVVSGGGGSGRLGPGQGWEEMEWWWLEDRAPCDVNQWQGWEGRELLRTCLVSGAGA